MIGRVAEWGFYSRARGPASLHKAVRWQAVQDHHRATERVDTLVVL